MGKRHGGNQNSSSVYSYSERRKDTKQCGYGTLHERLGADSFKEFDCCSLTLQPCRNPVITPHGYVFDKESILTYILHQKKENARKLKEWEKARSKLEQEKDDRLRAVQEAKKRKFVALEGTPAHPGVLAADYNDPEGPSAEKNRKVVDCARQAVTQTHSDRLRGKDDDDEWASKAGNSARTTTSEDSVSNMDGEKSKHLPSFWVPQLNPSAKTETVVDEQAPSQKVLCPMSGRPLKVKDLMPVKFTRIAGDDPSKSDAGKTIRGVVVTMDCVEKIIRKEMVDPISGETLTDSDIIALQRGGTGFAATNEVKAKLARPVIELQ